MSDPGAAIHGHITDFFTRVADAREKVCEAALLSGGYGVKETWSAPDRVEFELSRSVPFGEVHVHDGIDHSGVGE